MIEDTKVTPKGSDWTRLLTDPDLVSHIGKLLQTYREVPPGQREAALLAAMREIKDAAVKARETELQDRAGKAAGKDNAAKNAPEAAHPQPVVELFSPQPVDQTPPFAADWRNPHSESGRRHFQRIKCCVAVEIHVEGENHPVWGNLTNIGRGGCLVETASTVPSGKALEIGLWLASGKVWVKGVILSGVATHSASYGVRVKFSQTELLEKEHLREFLKFVDCSVRKAHSEKAYVAELKR